MTFFSQKSVFYAQIWPNDNFPKKFGSISFWRLWIPSNIQKIKKIYWVVSVRNCKNTDRQIYQTDLWLPESWFSKNYSWKKDFWKIIFEWIFFFLLLFLTSKNCAVNTGINIYFKFHRRSNINLSIYFFGKKIFFDLFN